MFRDSFLLLPLSLNKLSNQFNVGGQSRIKTVFPHKFLNDSYNKGKTIDLNYKGIIPGLEFFDNIQSFNSFMDEYLSNSMNNNSNSMNNNSKVLEEKATLHDHILNNWSLRKEAIIYCMNDCISLYQVLTHFNKIIFEKFNLNLTRFPTLSSLTFGIFRANYLDKLHKKGYFIPVINGSMYNDIKKSYTGGSTDMFIPSNDKGEKVYCYDVNSLYPTIMANYSLMPVISKKQFYITYFEGNINDYNLSTLFKDKPFGFFNVDIKSPNELKHPFLQMKFNTGNGERTISPLGD